jgi:hypothetical protein
VSEDGRIFVNFPRWSEDVPVSVAEVMKGRLDQAISERRVEFWRNAKMSEVSSKDHFVRSSVVADGKGSLWVIDPTAPNCEMTAIANGHCRRLSVVRWRMRGSRNSLRLVRVALRDGSGGPIQLPAGT